MSATQPIEEKRQKTGGRKPGSLNKATLARAALAGAEADGGAGGAGGARPEPVQSHSGRGRARGTPPKDGLPGYRHERLDRLIPFDQNARTHSSASVDKLAKLIKAFGWTSPILVAGRHILAGHARRLAAMKLGIETVPVIDLKHLSAAEREAVILSDNRAALDGGWDMGLLIGAFERLQELGGLDLTLTGFDVGEIGDFLGDGIGGGGLSDSGPDDTDERRITCPSCGHEFPLKAT